MSSSLELGPGAHLAHVHRAEQQSGRCATHLERVRESENGCSTESDDIDRGRAGPSAVGGVFWDHEARTDADEPALGGSREDSELTEDNVLGEPGQADTYTEKRDPSATVFAGPSLRTPSNGARRSPVHPSHMVHAGRNLVLTATPPHAAN